MFRLLAATVAPVLFLAVLECGLRLAGYGYLTSFFRPARIDGRDYYVTNDRFGFRFFPPSIARTPFPLRMPAVKPTNSYRIFLFGESAAQGDPDPTFGVGRYLEVLLRERFPGTYFNVVCVAMTAINSHAILPIARECARHDGDLWLIYMGNNEMVGPFGAGTVFGPPAPRLALIRTSLALKSTRIGQLLDAVISAFGANGAARKSWRGMSMFKEHQLRHDDPRRLRAYDNFAANLEDILRAGYKSGVPIILSTVGSNLKDCAPFASLHKAGLDEAQRSAWEKSYQSGTAAEGAEDYRGALNDFSNAAAIDSEFADLAFRMGRCELALSNALAAKRDFVQARDDDALGFRADTRINRIIRKAAELHRANGVHLADAAEELAARSPFGIPGKEYFYEHVHLNFDGNYQLARIFADRVSPLLPPAITNRDNGQWASAQFCDHRLAVSPWDRYRVWQENFSRVSEPPFTGQLNDVPRAKMYMARLDELRSQMTPEAEKQTRATYREALAAAPDDASLHENYAQFLGEIGDLPAAVMQEERVCALLPEFPGPFHKRGLLLVREGDMDAAAAQFSRALVLRKDYVPALNQLGVILGNRREVAAAGACFTNALRLNPGYAETYVNLGFLQQSEGQLNEALARYQQAAKLQPEGPAAHFSRAVALAANHERSQAIKFFQAAVWMNPEFWQAHYLLGVELALDGKVGDAQAQFREVVRLRPDFAKAHLNLGVALAKQNRLEEATAQFRAVLNLNPTNQAAQHYLDTIRTLKMRAH